MEIFSKRSRVGLQRARRPVAWDSAPEALCSPDVWPGSPLFRRERDQTRLFDPAAPAHPEHRAQLERGADRPLPVDEQRQRHAERNAIVVTAWEIARQKGATIEERREIYEREVDRLSREFEEKWGVPARV